MSIQGTRQDYEIIATLGPSSQSEVIWSEMLAAGVTAFRLNTSHLSLAQLPVWLDRLVPFIEAAAPRLALVLDLQGSKWRLGDFPAFELVEGRRVELVQAGSTTGEGILPVPHADFFTAAHSSSAEMVLNDAKISLLVESAGPEKITARVVRGGQISARKGITYRASSYRQEALGEKDRAVFAETRSLSFTRYAISYVKDAAEMASYRALLGPSYLIAKLERGLAVEQAARVAAAADEVWLCRGDLGAELGLRAMAESAHRFSRYIESLPVPAILAGQVLEHMTARPTPTRAEVCAIHDALVAGYRGFVLSDETAIGNQPVEACRVVGMFKD